MFSSHWKPSALALLACAGAALAPEAVAQIANPSSAATTPETANGQLEEVVVTAQRREQKLQSTPVSVTALTAATLDRLDVQQPTQLSQLVPNFQLTQGSGGPTNVAISIRGIGNQEPLLTVDSPVGVYLDGVYLGREAGLNIDLVDLERVEVLRGPQGTLFGRNTSGGAVSLVTKMPSTDFGIQEKTGWGEYDGWYTRTELNTGDIADTGLRATVSYLHRDRDGWVKNPYSSDADGPASLHSDAVWARVHGDFGPLAIDYMFDFDTLDGQNEGFQLAAMSPLSQAYFSQSPNYGGDPLVLSGHRRDPLPLYRFPGQGPTQHAMELGHAVTAKYDLTDDIAFKSITAYRHWYASEPTRYGPHFRGPVLNFNTFTVSIQDVTPFAAPQDVSQYQVSQEFQIIGTADRFKYIAGAYYFYEHVHEDNPNNYTVVLPGSTFGLGAAYPVIGINTFLPNSRYQSELRYRENSSSYAGFGQVDYTPPILDDKLTVTGGLRYTVDHRSIDLYDLDAVPRTGLHDYYAFNYNFELNYQATQELMGYIRISSGYKSGGFNARQTAATASLNFSPEKAQAYEIGMKSEWLDHTLRANASAFYTDYSNLQVNQYTGGIGTTLNTNAYYEGFELELQAAPITPVLLEASVGYVNPVYTSYPYPNPDTGVLQNYASIAKFPYVPDWTIHLGAQYTFNDTPWGTPSVRADYSMTSERYFFGTDLPNANPFNNVIKDPGQNLISVRAALSNIPVFGDRANMEVQIYGENLLNQDLRDSAIDFGGLGFAGISFGMPRSFGFDVNLKY